MFTDDMVSPVQQQYPELFVRQISQYRIKLSIAILSIFNLNKLRLYSLLFSPSSKLKSSNNSDGLGFSYTPKTGKLLNCHSPQFIEVIVISSKNSFTQVNRSFFEVTRTNQDGN
ncbi:hypothetical protein D3C85_1474240 [compost metagenome]